MTQQQVHLQSNGSIALPKKAIIKKARPPLTKMSVMSKESNGSRQKKASVSRLADRNQVASVTSRKTQHQSSKVALNKELSSDDFRSPVR